MNIYRKYIPKYWLPFTAAVICVAGEAGCDLLGPAFMSHIINNGIEKQSLAAVYRWGLYMLAATAAGALFAVTRNIISSTVSQHFGADLRYDLFNKVLRFSTQSADKIESGSLITRMTNDISQVVNFINGMMRIFFKAPLTCIGSMVLASLLNFRLSLIIYAVIAAVALLLFISMKLSYPRYELLQKAMDKVNTRVEEYLMGIRLVKAFGTYGSETEKFEKDNTGLYRKNVSAQIIITFFSPLLTLASGCGTVLILYEGSRMFTAGSINPGEISAFIVYMAQIVSSLLMITNIFNNFVRTKASDKRIAEVIMMQDDFSAAETDALFQVQETLSVPEAVHTALSVSFTNVTFSYPDGSGTPALRNISFSVQEGRSLAVIGPTGSGKSTLAWLLIRLYDADAGSIMLGEKNIRTLSVNEVRRNIALVPQKALLFSGTVRDNITWGKRDAGEDEILRAVHMAGADFILGTKDGLAAELGSGGVNLSGGQKQRLSIARALIKKAPVLVLDDATSALDAITEGGVRRAILSENENATVIFITQRCSIAMAADAILVLEDGMMRGYGTHSELLRTCSVYRDIFSSQLGGLTDGGR
jgi:ATP-binding cassette, subfamily B, multidrug efflux pump